MQYIQLNEKELISLNKNTILSSIILCSSNETLQEGFNENLSKIISDMAVDILSGEYESEIIDDGDIRVMILYGLKQKIEKELSNYNI